MYVGRVQFYWKGFKIDSVATTTPGSTTFAQVARNCDLCHIMRSPPSFSLCLYSVQCITQASCDFIRFLFLFIFVHANYPKLVWKMHPSAFASIKNRIRAAWIFFISTQKISFIQYAFYILYEPLSFYTFKCTNKILFIKVKKIKQPSPRAI